MIKYFLLLFFAIASFAKTVNFTTDEISIIKKAHFKPNILKIYNTPFKSYKTDASWIRYKKHILTKKNYKLAKQFMSDYHDTLQQVEDIYGVQKEVITAFLAIESRFCKVTGNTNILDALTTLAFNKNRMQDFFRYELKQFLNLCKVRGWDPLNQFGSFAGAMGCVQQLPSIQLKYGVDFDEDGEINPYSLLDSMASIANFLASNGWDKNSLIAIKAKFDNKAKKLKVGYNKVYKLSYLKKHHIYPVKKFPQNRASLLKLYLKGKHQLWLGAKNMRIITKYNHSTNYGMGIFKFSQALKQK